MNVKKKAIGIVIAAILLFSFTFLAMAQSTTGTPYFNFNGSKTNAYPIGSNTDGRISSGTNAYPVGSGSSYYPVGSNTDYNVGSHTDNPVYDQSAGDVDGDGVVTPGDARLTLRASVQLERFTSIQFISADTDFDGVITAADARTILRRAVGLFA